MKPFVEQQPLGDINQIFNDVHEGKYIRRVILVPPGQEKGQQL